MDAYIRSAIISISESHGGTLTPELVVEEARPEGSPLHDQFTWDDAAAAHEHRLYEARALIRSIRVEVTTTEFRVQAPMFVRDPDAGHSQGYVVLTDLLDDEMRARRVVKEESGRAEAALERAAAVANVLDLDREAQKLIRLVGEFREKATAPKAPQRKPPKREQPGVAA